MRLATGPGGVTLYYDPTGRLSRLTQGTSTTRFDHLGPRLVIERDAAGTILRRYVHGPGDDEPLVWYEGATLSDKRWLHTDERGSVVAISDASGASIATNRYDEYGIPQGSNTGRFQYTGQAWVAEQGLYYYKARFYSPTLGRFMQTDPIGYKDGINWYDYVKGDPVNRVDPDGQCVGPLAIPCGFALAEKALEGIVVLATVCIAWCPRPKLPSGDQPAVAPPTPQPTTATPPAPQGPTISEARGKRSPTYTCSNPLCGAPHGGLSETSECHDCARKRQNGDNIPGKPIPKPHVPPDRKPPPEPPKSKLKEQK